MKSRLIDLAVIVAVLAAFVCMLRACGDALRGAVQVRADVTVSDNCVWRQGEK